MLLLETMVKIHLRSLQIGKYILIDNGHTQVSDPDLRTKKLTNSSIIHQLETSVLDVVSIFTKIIPSS